MIAFPGSGAEFPIGPGESRVVAVSAIDHSFAHPDLGDLSDADFEIPGTGFADNPSVPDMVDVGLEPFRISFGSGSHTPLIPSTTAYFLAEPQTPVDLPIAHRAFGGRGFVIVPAPTLIDVAALTIVYPDSDREFGPCVPVVHPSFDRYEGGFMPVVLGVEEPRLSFQRQVLRYSDGHATLADASVRAADFILADLTPGEPAASVTSPGSARTASRLRSLDAISPNESPVVSRHSGSGVPTWAGAGPGSGSPRAVGGRPPPLCPRRPACVPSEAR